LAGKRSFGGGGVVMAESLPNGRFGTQKNSSPPLFFFQETQERSGGIVSLGGACSCLFTVVSINVMGTKLENPER